MKKLIGVAASILIFSASGALAGNGHHRARYASLDGAHDYSANAQMDYGSAARNARHRHFARRQAEWDTTAHWTPRDNSCFNLPYLPEEFACSWN
jgi:hypothetical protein